MSGDEGGPRYLQVAYLMRRAIGTGVYPVGTVLPSVVQLAATYEVPPPVIGAALRELRTEGLVSGRTGDTVSVIDESGSASASCLDS